MTILETVSIKVPREVKEKMKELHRVNWPEELRAFIIRRIKEIERRKALEEVEEILKTVKGVPKGTSAKLVREDRDGH